MNDISGNRTRLGENFAKCVNGYHLVNEDPIKESAWEGINATILNASGIAVTAQSGGSHQSGSDLECSFGNLSNKSAKYSSNKKYLTISSYRLTTVCSGSANGCSETIIAEINARKNFAYYSVIVREDTKTHFNYDWFVIPSDYPALNPSSYKWHIRQGKTEKNKDRIMGWETERLDDGSYMHIDFSMSSQLWIDVKITDEMKAFVVGSCSASRSKKYDYIGLYEQDLIAQSFIN